MRGQSSSLCIVIERQRAPLLTMKKCKVTGGPPPPPSAWQSCLASDRSSANQILPFRDCESQMNRESRLLLMASTKADTHPGHLCEKRQHLSLCTGASGAALAHILLLSLIFHLSISESARPTNAIPFLSLLAIKNHH